MNKELDDANNEEKAMVEVAQKAFIELATQTIKIRASKRNPISINILRQKPSMLKK